MTRQLVGRFVGLLGVLAALTLAVFVIKAVLPADPVRASIGARATEAQVKAKRAELGYDKPIVVQYVTFVGDVVTLDLGDSLRTRRPVTTDIGNFLPATAELALAAAVLAGIGGVGLGIVSARGGKLGSVTRLAMLAFASAPTFCLALLAILLFYRRLGWLPSSGRITRSLAPPERTRFVLVDTVLAGDLKAFRDAVQHLVLPALCLAIGPAVAIGRVLRGSLLDVLRQDHTRTARSKGLSRRAVLTRHALRNALGPTLSMTGLQLGLLLSGVVVVELVFAWPGLGLYTTQAIQNADFPAVIGIVLVMGTAYVVINAIVDIAQVIADPRLQTSGAR
jgi:peptide/nickel transport system permease protein